MQLAGPMNVLRTLAILFFIYYVVKFLARIFAPVLLKKMMEKMQQKAAEQFQQQQPPANEGETTIDKKPRNTQQGKSSVGEYVEYEEIQDDES